ncbi:hypothetical protein GIB67_000102, partial [Kingdonia uniflora]
MLWEIIFREENASYYKISMLSWWSSQKDNTQNLSLNAIVVFEQLAVIPKGEAVPSRDLHKRIDKLITKYEDVVKRLKEKESFEAWHQAMKKEFYSEELAEKDDSTFIELFDQYDRFYTIAQQGPK